MKKAVRVRVSVGFHIKGSSLNFMEKSKYGVDTKICLLKILARKFSKDSKIKKHDSEIDPYTKASMIYQLYPA